jgi:PAS domain S-box-containing protein
LSLRAYVVAVIVIYVVVTGAGVGYALTAANDVENNVLWIAIAGPFLLLLASLVLYWRLAKPLKQLSSAVRSAVADAMASSIAIGPAAREIASLVEDINELLKADDREELTTARLAAIVESSDDTILGATLDGVITSWNPGATKMYGYTSDEIVGRHVTVLAPPERLDELEAALATVARGEPVPGYETKRVRKDGTLIDVSVVVSPIRDRSGKAIGVSAAIRDITGKMKDEAELRSLEERIHQSQRLESVGQLAGGVAHDFNNLLAVILNYASFVQDELAGATGRERDDRLARIERDIAQISFAAERAAGLTRQLLAFAKGDVTRPEVLSLNDVVLELESMLTRTLGEDIVVSTRLEPDIHRTKIDRGQLEQMLVNLAVNARDAMPNGGTLTIETANTTIDPPHVVSRPNLRAGSYVQLRVSDNGIGMCPDVAARAFEPFFTTKPKGEGTGLGLATIFGIANQAGGDVSLVSEPGFGTTVTVLLPETNAEPTRGDDQPNVQTRGSGQAVLVVEDEDALREVSRRILERAGFRVFTAANGSEALSILHTINGKLDLLLTDVVMPQMLGEELAEKVLDLHPETAVIFMSGYAEPALDRRAGLLADATFLDKPFTQIEILDKVASALHIEAAS